MNRYSPLQEINHHFIIKNFGKNIFLSTTRGLKEKDNYEFIDVFSKKELIKQSKDYQDLFSTHSSNRKAISYSHLLNNPTFDSEVSDDDLFYCFKAKLKTSSSGSVFIKGYSQSFNAGNVSLNRRLSDDALKASFKVNKKISINDPNRIVYESINESKTLECLTVIGSLDQLTIKAPKLLCLNRFDEEIIGHIDFERVEHLDLSCKLEVFDLDCLGLNNCVTLTCGVEEFERITEVPMSLETVYLRLIDFRKVDKPFDDSKLEEYRERFPNLLFKVRLDYDTTVHSKRTDENFYTLLTTEVYKNFDGMRIRVAEDHFIDLTFVNCSVKAVERQRND